MTVLELVNSLLKYPQDLEVVIQEDAEGNGYHGAFCTGLAYDDPDYGYPPTKDTQDYVDEDYVLPDKKVVIIG